MASVKAGDICLYFFDNANKSISLVEVVNNLTDEISVVKLIQVIVDDSGNDLFKYLCKTGKTMNVSNKYLHTIDLINRQQVEIDALQDREIELENNLQEAQDLLDILKGECETVKSEAIKEFAERLKEKLSDCRTVNDFVYTGYDTGDTLNSIDNLVKEMVGDT